MFIC